MRSGLTLIPRRLARQRDQAGDGAARNIAREMLTDVVAPALRERGPQCLIGIRANDRVRKRRMTKPADKKNPLAVRKGSADVYAFMDGRQKHHASIRREAVEKRQLDVAYHQRHVSPADKGELLIALGGRCPPAYPADV